MDPPKPQENDLGREGRDGREGSWPGAHPVPAPCEQLPQLSPSPLPPASPQTVMSSSVGRRMQENLGGVFCRAFGFPWRLQPSPPPVPLFCSLGKTSACLERNKSNFPTLGLEQDALCFPACFQLASLCLHARQHGESHGGCAQPAPHLAPRQGAPGASAAHAGVCIIY